MKNTMNLIVTLLVIGAIVAYPVMYYSTKGHVTFTITDKDIKRESESSDKYLIYTEDETFEITDLLLKGYFRSSDDYGHLKVGKKYRCTCYGWRSGFLSMYRNIKGCKEVEE